MTPRIDQTIPIPRIDVAKAKELDCGALGFTFIRCDEPGSAPEPRLG